MLHCHSSVLLLSVQKNMIKFSQQPVTKQQKIVFPAHDLNLEGYKIKSTLTNKIFSTLMKRPHEPMTFNLKLSKKSFEFCCLLFYEIYDDYFVLR